MLRKLNYLIKSTDYMTSPGYRLFHLNGDVKYRSTFGGIFTILLFLFVLYVAIIRAFQYFNDMPRLHSIESSRENDGSTVSLSEIGSLPVISIVTTET